jgi:hypothetical protein
MKRSLARTTQADSRQSRRRPTEVSTPMPMMKSFGNLLPQSQPVFPADRTKDDHSVSGTETLFTGTATKAVLQGVPMIYISLPSKRARNLSIEVVDECSRESFSGGASDRPIRMQTYCEDDFDRDFVADDDTDVTSEEESESAGININNILPETMNRCVRRPVSSFHMVTTPEDDEDLVSSGGEFESEEEDADEGDEHYSGDEDEEDTETSSLEEEEEVESLIIGTPVTTAIEYAITTNTLVTHNPVQLACGQDLPRWTVQKEGNTNRRPDWTRKWSRQAPERSTFAVADVNLQDARSIANESILASIDEEYFPTEEEEDEEELSESSEEEAYSSDNDEDL